MFLDYLLIRQVNHIPHRQEMDEVLESLKNRIINSKPEECLNPFAVVINYISEYDV